MSPVFLPPQALETQKPDYPESAATPQCGETISEPMDTNSTPIPSCRSLNLSSIDEIAKEQSAFLIELKNRGASQDTGRYRTVCVCVCMGGGGGGGGFVE